VTVYMKPYIDIIKKTIHPTKPIPTAMKKSGTPRYPVRAFLFDIYGTLFISGSGDVSESEEQVEIERLGRLLKDSGIEKNPQIIIENYYNRIREFHEEQKKRGVDFPEVQIDEVWMKVLDIDRERARGFAVWFESLFNPVFPMPSVEKLFSCIREAGFTAGIISNAQFYTPLLFNALMGAGAEKLGFDKKLLFYSHIEGHAKPSVYMFNRARQRLNNMGIAPQNVLYTGNDILNDILPARTAGFQTALFAGDARSLRLRNDDERCRGISPDIVVTNLMQLAEYISE